MSKIIVQNADGSSPYVDINKKLEKVKGCMSPVLEDIKMKIAKAESNIYNKTKYNYNSVISNKLNIILRKEPLLDYTSAINMPYDYLKDHYDAFLDLLEFIYDYCPEFVPTKPTFCAWLGTTTSNYNKLHYDGSDTEIIELLNSADDMFYESVTTSAISGIGKEKSSLDYAREKSKGLSIDLKSENTNTTNIMAIEYSSENRNRLLQNILGNTKEK